eukprot:COSAG04_NODE_3145_length_3123_cov_14.192130_2_plen_686_part_01
MLIHFCKRMANSSWTEPAPEPENPEPEPELEPQLPEGHQFPNHDWLGPQLEPSSGGGTSFYSTEHLQCASEFAGAAIVTPCAEAFGEYTLSGCAKHVCVTPPPDACVDSPSGWTNRYGESCSQTVSYYGCRSSYSCSEYAQWDSSTGQYICGGVSAAEACCECGGGSSMRGYSVTEVELDVTIGFNVSATCSDGYFGTPVVTACTASGSYYELSGCEPMCTLPLATPGYTFGLEPEPEPAPVSTPPTPGPDSESAPHRPQNHDWIWSQVVGRHCSSADTISEYSSEAEARTACADNPACASVSDSGCDGAGTWKTCSSPIGSSSSSSCLYLKPASPGIALQCAPDYVGSPTVTPCTGALGEYSLSGCSRPPTHVCVTPPRTTCTDADWISYHGYTCSETALYYGDESGDCTHRYACTESAEYDYSIGEYVCGGVSAGEACCECGGGVTSRHGYNITEVELDVQAGFNVSATCLENFFGTPVVTPCAADGGAYGLSGCEPMCVLPVDTPGYAVHVPVDCSVNFTAGDPASCTDQAGCSYVAPVTEACTTPTCTLTAGDESACTNAYDDEMELLGADTITGRRLTETIYLLSEPGRRLQAPVTCDQYIAEGVLSCTGNLLPGGQYGAQVDGPYGDTVGFCDASCGFCTPCTSIFVCSYTAAAAEVAESCLDTDSSGDDCSGFAAGDAG